MTVIAGLLLATVGRHNGLIWGVILFAGGAAHLLFRQWRARRWKAVHDARQDTAPSFARPLHRRHDQSYYVMAEVIVGAVMILLGLVLIAANV